MKIKSILATVALVALFVPSAVMADTLSDIRQAIMEEQGEQKAVTIDRVIVQVKNAVSNEGVSNSLVAKLTNANEKADSNPAAAKKILQAVQNQLKALSGKKVDADDAVRLSNLISRVLNTL